VLRIIELLLSNHQNVAKMHSLNSCKYFLCYQGIYSYCSTRCVPTRNQTLKQYP